jgi:choline-sulfatase
MSLRTLKVPRREFLKVTAAGLAGLSLRSLDALDLDRSATKPNILLIMSDEHNPAITGSYGNQVVHTPNMDWIAKQGVTFETHYCNSPLCVPSRASFTAGKYCSRVDVWGLTSELPSADIPSIPRVMNAAGYESFLCGKQHYDYSRRYGFTEVGGNFNFTYKTGLGKRKSPADITSTQLSPLFDQFHPGNHGKTVEHDIRVTAGAVDFLSKRKASDKPFFLFTGYLAPHYPLVIPEAYWDRYKGKVGMPTAAPPGFFENMPLNYKVLRAGFDEMNVPDDITQRGRELYYGLVNWVDNEIGKVLTTLHNNKEIADNTVIIYTSDHGENMGEHGMWHKNCMYEQSARVPLSIMWPGRWIGGQRRAGASSHLDLVKTIVEIGGGQTPVDWNGDSMLSWIENPKHKWKDYAVSEYYAKNIASGYVMARSGRWKYTYHTTIDKQHPDFHELYDLSADPYEFNNLAGHQDQAKRVKEMHARMVAEVGGDPNVTEQRARRQLTEGYNRTDKKPEGATDGDSG